MGIFDNLMSVFTGAPGQEAAKQSQAFIQQQQAANNARIAAAEQGGLGDLRTGREAAVGAIQPAFAEAKGAVAGATPDQINALYGGQALASGALTGAVDPAMAALYGGAGAAATAYDPLAAAAGRYGAAGGQASTMSADALGLNGPEGVARAQAAFTEGPGYKWALSQGLEGVGRQANMAGMGASGNAMLEALKFSQGLAGQEWDKYLQNVRARESLYAPLERGALGDVASGLGQIGLTTGGRAADIYRGTGQDLGSLYSKTGQLGADVYGTEGRTLAQLAAQGGLAQSGAYMDEAQRAAALRQGLAGTGSTFAQNTLTPYSNAAFGGAQAQQQAGLNTLGLGLGLGNMFAPSVGGMGGGTLPNTMLPGSGGGMFFTG